MPGFCSAHAAVMRARASATSCARIARRTCHRSSSVTAGEFQSQAAVSKVPSLVCASSTMCGSVHVGACTPLVTEVMGTSS